jgi:hypothetical protein
MLYTTSITPKYQLGCRLNEVQSQCELGEENPVLFLGSDPGYSFHI